MNVTFTNIIAIYIIIVGRETGRAISSSCNYEYVRESVVSYTSFLDLSIVSVSLFDFRLWCRPFTDELAYR